MKTAIVLEISSCAVCPYVKFVNSTEVKFSYSYYCTKKQADILKNIRLNSELERTPPAWCPCRVENYNFKFIK